MKLPVIAFMLLASEVCAAAEENRFSPLVNGINRLEARAVMPPCDSKELAGAIARLEAPRESSPYVASLNGEWDFEWRSGADGDAPRHARLNVPGCWQLQGDFDPPLYTNLKYPHPVRPPIANGYNGAPASWTIAGFPDPIGIYERDVEIPAGWNGRRIVIHFAGVSSALTLHIDGKMAGYSEDSRLPAEFDITGFTADAPRKIHIKAEVRKFCDGSYLEDQDMWRLSGIFRDVWVQAEAKEAARDFIVDADAATGRVRISDENGKTIHEETIDGFELWSPESPNLYTVAFQSGGDWHAVNVGFRTVKIKDGVLLLNGERTLIKGVNRHEISPVGGYTMTRGEMEKDIAILKKFGFNAVRTCHYPDDPLWYDLCDKAGLVLFSEANIESHGMGFGPHSPAKDPLWKQSHVERNENQVKVLRNHPSIIVWSMGNEAGWGENFASAHRSVKALDPSRPIHYEGAGHADGFNYWFDVPSPGTSDIASFMYPDPPKIAAWLAAHDGKMPYILCEYAHAMGNSTGDFAAYWSFAEKYRSFQGGFIWDFADQGLLGKDGRLKYGGDFGDMPNDANFCCNGLFDAWRNPHPGAYEVAHVFGARPENGYFPAAPDALYSAARFKRRNQDCAK